MKVTLAEIPGAFHLPRPRWDVIRSWVEKHVAEPDRPAAWESVAVQWLDLLNEALLREYKTHRSGRLLLFAPRCHPDAAALLQAGESAITAIVDTLGNLASETWCGPLVILLFADAETYYLYTAPFNPDARSGGMCYRDGEYTHIALRPYPLEALRRSMLHELTHACLGHLPLPQWLEEGFTQYAEGHAGGDRGGLALSTATMQEARRYWAEHGLGAFWWGDCFYFSDEGFEHSYRLASILFHFLNTEYRRQLPDFVRHAHADDAGASAAREFLGKSLGELAAQFFGPGPWEPTPPDAVRFARRGALRYSQHKFDQAVADFDEAIRLDPQLPHPYTNRGSLRALFGEYALAVTDYEEAIRLDPKDHHTHNNLAWLRATCPNETFRDGRQALEHASKACELSKFNVWYCVGTLAAAYAELGDFEEARTFAKESLKQAPEGEKAMCRERLRLYREGKPYREDRSQPTDCP